MVDVINVEPERYVERHPNTGTIRFVSGFGNQYTRTRWFTPDEARQIRDRLSELLDPGWVDEKGVATAEQLRFIARINDVEAAVARLESQAAGMNEVEAQAKMLRRQERRLIHLQEQVAADTRARHEVETQLAEVKAQAKLSRDAYAMKLGSLEAQFDEIQKQLDQARKSGDAIIDEVRRERERRSGTTPRQPGEPKQPPGGREVMTDVVLDLLGLRRK